MNIPVNRAGVALAMSLLVAPALAASATHPLATPRGAPQDWSNRHVVIAHPDTPEEAAARGRSAQWSRQYRDPRFVLALMRKLDRQAVIADARHSSTKPPHAPRPPHGPAPGAGKGVHRDWSQTLGGLSGSGMAGIYPAKYSFDINAAPDCSNDFVAYTTNVRGSTATGVNVETRASNFTSAASSGSITIGAAATARSVTLTAGATNSGTTFQTGTSTAQNALNLIAAVNRWSFQTGISAKQLPVINPANVRFERNSPGNTSTIPVSGTLSGYNIGGASNGSGTAGQPTIVATNQLYSSCNAALAPYRPDIYWSYNTSLSGQSAIAETSPVISWFDGGAQVAFVQRDPAADQLQLVLLKWQGGQGTAGYPAVPTLSANAGAYRSCTGNCMFVITFDGATTVAGGERGYSSPYVDYFGDVVWVGDGLGKLHKFTGVFGGNPAEVVNASFPATVSSGNTLSSPVYDGSTGQVFVGSGGNGSSSGGRLHKVDAASGAVTSSAKLSANASLGIFASPILDASAQRVYAFVYNDGSGNCNGGACRTVVQFDTGFASGDAGSKVTVGRGADSVGEQYVGTFDDAYYSSPTPDGALYVVGGDPNSQWISVLWKIPIVGNAMQAPMQGATISGNDLTLGSYTGPLSEIRNGSNEYLFVGVHDYADDGTASVCGNNGAAGASCLFMFNLNDLNGAAAGTGAAWGTSNVPSAGMPVVGGTGGIVVDNISATAGASQVYFSNLASPGNAYQASQSGLQ